MQSEMLDLYVSRLRNDHKSKENSRLNIERSDERFREVPMRESIHSNEINLLPNNN